MLEGHVADEEDYMQLLFGCLPDGTDQRSIGIDSQASGRKPLGNAMIQQLQPAILKPRRLWSGKQLVSTVLLNLGCPLTLTAKGKVRDLWGASHAEESYLVIQEGVVLTGVLDKNQLGAAEDGLTHAIYEFYGPEAAATFLTTMARPSPSLTTIGFTCRMDDLLLKPQADKARRAKFQQAEWLGKQVATNYTAAEGDDELRQGMEQVLRHDELLRGLDSAMKGAMNKVTSGVMECACRMANCGPFPYNNMALMTQTGAKGSMVNFSQISGCLGQQELEGGGCPSWSVGGKTLPSFPAWDTRARAGGYISHASCRASVRKSSSFTAWLAGRA